MTFHKKAVELYSNALDALIRREQKQFDLKQEINSVATKKRISHEQKKENRFIYSALYF